MFKVSTSLVFFNRIKACLFINWHQVINCYTTLLKFVHDVRDSVYILHLVLRENFGLNLRARISSAERHLKVSFINSSSSISMYRPSAIVKLGWYSELQRKKILVSLYVQIFCSFSAPLSLFLSLSFSLFLSLSFSLVYANLFPLSIPVPLE